MTISRGSVGKKRCQPLEGVFQLYSGERPATVMSKKPEGRIAKTKVSSAKKKPAAVASQPKKAAPKAPSTSPALEQLGELPRSYGSNLIFLVAQEPHWLFTYWDIDISRHPGGPTFLRIVESPATIEGEIEVPFETRNWYIPVKNAGSRYAVEIGYYRGSTWNTIARSVEVQTPADQVSGRDDFDYATIPLHISFQKLTENLQAALRSGETATQALARLQKEGQFSAFGAPAGELSAEDRFVVEALLGKELMADLSSGSLSSDVLETRIREQLKLKLSSEGTSELLSRSQWSSSEGLPGLLDSLSSAALSSWTNASGIAIGASETLASWNQAPQSSWSAANLSSWLLQTGQTSWSQAALSSWNEAALSSWSHGATSLSGSSENLSSFGFGESKRDFYMHVNAEVIFYGGTDPRAKVTIDGKSVALNHDGSFRHHFIFPDGTYEIPIVATSPDGAETRGAILRFDRNTQRHGKVDATAQPPLGTPMGARP